MADLSSKYLGLDLRNPILAASSGLTGKYDHIVELENHGVGGIVLKSNPMFAPHFQILAWFWEIQKDTHTNVKQ